MPASFPSKLPEVGTTIFTVMSQLAAEKNALNLSQGFPDFGNDPELAELLHRHAAAGANQYAPMPGLPALRQRVAEKVNAAYPVQIDPEREVTITSGATEALYAAMACLLRPGDEVMFFEPAFDSYHPAIKLNGGVPVPIEMEPETYAIDWDRVRDRVTDKTKLILINSPHNPTGTALTAEDMAELSQIVQDNGLFVLSDEVYEHIVFDGLRHESVLHYPELYERGFAVFSFGKTFHLTGWKVGYCVAPPALTEEFRKVHQYLVFCTMRPAQHALADYMGEPSHYLGLPEFYQKKRDFFAKAMEGTPFRLLPCQGTYFQTASYAGFSDEPDTELAVRLTEEFGVATIPVSVFFTSKRDDKALRFCFAKTEETMAAAAERLKGIG